MFYVWKYTCSRFTITIITIFWHKVSIPFHIICIVYSYLINFFQFWLISKLLQHFNLVFKYIYFCLLKMSLKVSKYFQFFVTAVGGFTMPLMPKLKFLYVWLGCGKKCFHRSLLHHHFFAWIVSFNVWFNFYQFLKLLIRLRHHHLTCLTHYYPVLFFYTPWKHQKTSSENL